MLNYLKASTCTCVCSFRSGVSGGCFFAGVPIMTYFPFIVEFPFQQVKLKVWGIGRISESSFMSPQIPLVSLHVTHVKLSTLLLACAPGWPHCSGRRAWAAARPPRPLSQAVPDARPCAVLRPPCRLWPPSSVCSVSPSSPPSSPPSKPKEQNANQHLFFTS